MTNQDGSQDDRPADIVEVDPQKPADVTTRRAVDTLAAGGVIAFPTDTLYGIGCELGQTAAVTRIQAMRGIDLSKRPFTLLLPDIGALPHYAEVHEHAYRVMSRIFPGPYCAELVANARSIALGVGASEIAPGQRRTIGVRIPEHPFCVRMLWWLRHPILTVSAKGHGGDTLTTAQAIAAEYGTRLELIVDGGTLDGPPSTVVSLVDDWTTVLREGRGPTGPLLLA